ncbi:MAG: hypothetical protein M3510_03925, partial [Actinomycetota bacterium]|nr:hypothetical protein [Actinomycetota bacterium]
MLFPPGLALASLPWRSTIADTTSFGRLDAVHLHPSGPHTGSGRAFSFALAGTQRHQNDNWFNNVDDPAVERAMKSSTRSGGAGTL